MAPPFQYLKQIFSRLWWFRCESFTIILTASDCKDCSGVVQDVIIQHKHCSIPQSLCQDEDVGISESVQNGLYSSTWVPAVTCELHRRSASFVTVSDYRLIFGLVYFCDIEVFYTPLRWQLWCWTICACSGAGCPRVSFVAVRTSAECSNVIIIISSSSSIIVVVVVNVVIVVIVVIVIIIIVIIIISVNWYCAAWVKIRKREL